MATPPRTIALVAHDSQKPDLLRATADLLVTSPLLTDPAYVRHVRDHTIHREQLRPGH